MQGWAPAVCSSTSPYPSGSSTSAHVAILHFAPYSACAADDAALFAAAVPPFGHSAPLAIFRDWQERNGAAAGHPHCRPGTRSWRGPLLCLLRYPCLRCRQAWQERTVGFWTSALARHFVCMRFRGEPYKDFPCPFIKADLQHPLPGGHTSAWSGGLQHDSIDNRQ